MWYLLLDESGDLGFDFVNKKPSKYFTVCILATSNPDTYYGIRRAVNKTLKRKVNRGGRAKMQKLELKGTETNLEAKKYFYERVNTLKFGIYALTLNKRRLYEKLTHDKERVYNFVSRLVLDQIPFEKAVDRVQLIVDRSKGKKEVQEFNEYVFRQLKGRLDPKVPLNIDHLISHEEPSLQAVDLFAWGMFRKHEKGDSEWRDIFKEKVIYDEMYL